MRAQRFFTEQPGQWSDRKIRINKAKSASNVEKDRVQVVIEILFPWAKRRG